MKTFLKQFFCSQNSIKTWARDHRVHHKYVDTDADPHNSRRGFLYSHIGWICLKKHPEVKEKFKLVDLSDVMNDPVAAFQHRYYWPLVITFNIIIPVMVPVLYWGETFYVSFFMSVLRYLCVLNGAFFINSAAHMWGTKPYDATINPTENEGVSILAWGEGFHNYHHTFPYDYAASELGGRLNLATMFINLMAKIGLAYDLRSPPKELVLRRKQRTGDGSRG
ncbi:acyl-CoA desaturase 1-like [Aplysia californica]|uniref:Acyl-CoA desaturase 1-like n=1 Tax=Aplysia californica TaxID=6500 RepID=A0ABM0ZX50_APLCA|nr:acyl-CoA desaturase 1-like [Aplysia californica]